MSDREFSCCFGQWIRREKRIPLNARLANCRPPAIFPLRPRIRQQKSERLAPNDARHKLECTKRGKCGGNCRPVQLVAAKVMERVNAQSGTLPDTDVLVSDFWAETYLPHLKAKVKASTLNGYEKMWSGHLSMAFAGLTLKQYKTGMGTRFLGDLAQKGLGARSISHIKSFARAMFGHATALELIDSNPWRDAKNLEKGEVQRRDARLQS